MFRGTSSFEIQRSTTSFTAQHLHSVMHARLFKFYIALFTLVLLYTLTVFFASGSSEHNPVPVSSRSDSAAVKFWISRYLTWHDANRHNPNARRLVFKQNGAGIGDRVKALIAVYGYAVLTRRLLVIKWNEPYPLADVVDKKSRDRFVFREDLDSFGLSAKHGLDYKFRYFVNMPDSLINLLAGDVHTVTLKTGPPKQTPDILRQVLRGNRFKNESIPSFSPDIWKLAAREILGRSENIQNQVAQIRNGFGICGNGEQCSSPRQHYLSVHARIGFGVGESHWRFQRFKSHYRDIAVCLARAVREHAPHENVAVFVASDTLRWIPVFIDVMRREMPSVRVVHLTGVPTHIVNIKKSDQGRAIYRSLFVEMGILGDAIHTISLRSGFSMAAFWMGAGARYSQLDTLKCIKERKPVERIISNYFLEMD